MKSLSYLKDSKIGDIIDYGLDTYKRSFVRLFIISLILYLPFMLLYTILYQGLTEQILGLVDINPVGGYGEDPAGMLIGLAKFYLGLAAMGLVYAVFIITVKSFMDSAIIRIIYSKIIEGEDVTVKDAFKQSIKSFGKLVVSKLLYLLIMAGLVFIGYIIMVLVLVVLFLIMGTSMGGFTGGLPMGNPSLFQIIFSVILILVMILMIIAFFYLISCFMGRFAMGIQAVTIEGRKGAESISRCNRLGKGHFWSIGLIFAISYLMMSLIPMVVEYSTTLPAVFSQQLDSPMLKIGTIVSQVLMAVLQPIVTSILTVLFISLKVKKEGFDLELEVDELLKEDQQVQITGEIYEENNN